MRKPMTAMAALFVFTACDGNPFAAPETDTEAETTTTSVVTLPGTENPTAGGSILRMEENDGTGNGFAEAYTYDAATDTFFIDNLGFDGANTYSRDDEVASLGPFQVYENVEFIFDSSNNTGIGQFQHKAIRAVSTSGNTEFAIVRTGAYVPYGFGGFIYQRNNGVTLPTSGQAFYTGDYAGIRDFDGQGGLEYVTGTATIAIDFEDFNDGEAVQGQIEGRQVFDVSGNEITADIIAAYTANGQGVISTVADTLPTLFFTVGPGTMDAQGELTNGLIGYVSENGALTPTETGTYYAVVSGDNAEEIVGIVVVESTDPRAGNPTVRETGGFIVYR